jgi:hypothetical protein
MNHSHIAGGPLGVARIDTPHKPRSRNPSGLIKAALTYLAGAIRILAGAAIVEAIAAASFGFLAGTAIVVAMVMAGGISYLLAVAVGSK